MEYDAGQPMNDRYHSAIVRKPATTFAAGLTTANLGVPNYELALRQHAAYCQALESCGLSLTRLEADADYPDSTFVEDTAIVTEDCAILTRPGAASRQGEVEIIAGILRRSFSVIEWLQTPATLDGGDVCKVGSHYFIGLSERTNEAGAEQLGRLLSSFGYTSSIIDLGHLAGLLHLKSGVAHLGDDRLLVVEALADRPEFSSYDLLQVDPDEEYAANAIRVNEKLLIAKGSPKLAETLSSHGYQTIELEMSEFQKMDGGLSCLSLRF